jgi:hypothetical protein
MLLDLVMGVITNRQTNKYVATSLEARVLLVSKTLGYKAI